MSSQPTTNQSTSNQPNTSSASQNQSTFVTSNVEEEPDTAMDQAPDSPIESLDNQQDALAAAIRASLQGGSRSSNGQAKAAVVKDYGLPGSSWTGKKFNEDYEQALHRLVHVDYDPRKYGDPLLDG